MTQEEKKRRFGIFLNNHIGIIKKLCRGYSNSKEDMEDNVQEVCYQLWKSIDRFEGKSKPATWVYKLTLNVCLYNLKKRKRILDTPHENVVLLHKDDLHFFDDKDDPITMLYDAIKLLKPLDRAIIMLYLEKKRHVEIAEIVGLGVSNVGVRINRIKKELKKIIDERLA